MILKCQQKGCLFYTHSRYALVRHKCKQRDLTKKRRLDLSTTPKSLSINHTDNIEFLNEDHDDHIDNDAENIQPQAAFISSSSADSSQHIDESVPDSKSKDLILQFCNILDICNNSSSLKIFKRVLQIITDNDFDYKLFKNTITTFESCQQYRASILEGNFKNDGFTLKDVHCTIGSTSHKALYFQRDIISVLKNQLLLASPNDIIFQTCSKSNSCSPDSCSTDSIKHPLHSQFFSTLQFEIQQRIMSSSSADVVWHNDRHKKSFIGYLQLFTDKTVTSLKASGMVAHAVHATFINFSKDFRRFLIRNGHTIIGFLPTSSIASSTELPTKQIISSSINNSIISRFMNEDNSSMHRTDFPVDNINDNASSDNFVPLDDNVHLTSSASGRQLKILLIHNAMLQLLEPLLHNFRTGFETQISPNITWNCFPFLVSYCCDIPEAKDISAIRHNMNTNCPCHRCLATFADISNLKTSSSL